MRVPGGMNGMGSRARAKEAERERMRIASKHLNLIVYFMTLQGSYIGVNIVFQYNYFNHDMILLTNVLFKYYLLLKEQIITRRKIVAIPTNW